jgi:hypothetical protein
MGLGFQPFGRYYGKSLLLDFGNEKHFTVTALTPVVVGTHCPRAGHERWSCPE